MRFYLVKVQMNDDAAIILIQVGCRFIGKEDWRLLDESPGKGGSLFFPLAQFIGVMGKKVHEDHLICKS